jgi:predicted ArsR family transcriptional regulator
VDDPRDARIAAVAALDEPTRRRVYDHIARNSEPVSRDEAAAALEIPRTTAAFHLERLADLGLLDVVFQRRTGRTGPGAGRPAKLYQRSKCEIDVSLPERNYDAAGLLLAAALQEAEQSGESPRVLLHRRAYGLGREFGETAPPVSGDHDAQATTLRVLEMHGYEPRVEGDDIVLLNCPFHVLAQEHPELICGMNLCLLGGLLDGLAIGELTAHLDPAPARCCVRLKPTA